MGAWTLITQHITFFLFSVFCTSQLICVFVFRLEVQAEVQAAAATRMAANLDSRHSVASLLPHRAAVRAPRRGTAALLRQCESGEGLLFSDSVSQGKGCSSLTL